MFTGMDSKAQNSHFDSIGSFVCLLEWDSVPGGQPWTLPQEITRDPGTAAEQRISSWVTGKRAAYFFCLLTFEAFLNAN